MNRISRIGLYLVTAGLIAIVSLGTQRLLMIPRVYDAVYQMGDRLGTVLPNGYNNRYKVPRDECVTLRLAPKKPMLVREMFDSDPAGGVIPTRQTTSAGLNLRVVAVISAVYLATLMLIALVSRWRTQRRKLDQQQAGVLLASLGLGCVVCVLCATAFTAMRIFWTGVDGAFVRRSLIDIPGSKSVHINVHTLLAMSASERTLMLIAMVLTAVPLLIMIDAAMLSRAQQRRTKEGEPDQSILSRISGIPLVRARFSECSLRWVAGACYVLVTLTFWSAPWSITMAKSLWSAH